MILVLDVANSDIVVGCVRDGATVFSCRISTDISRKPMEYASTLALVAGMENIDLRRAEGAIVSSVVPQLTSVIVQAVHIASGQAPLVVGPGLKTGLSIRIDDPLKLGGDFVAAAVAALDRYPLPCVTIDMGTATAIGVLDKNGCYIGGIIAPGVLVSQNALVTQSSQLPHVGLEAPQKAIGRNTEASMRSGMVFGSAAMVDGLLERIEAELGAKPSVIATGELAEAVIPHCRRPDIVLDRDLILRGLWLLYVKNRKSK